MPSSPSIADTLGWALYQKGNYGEARDLLEEAVKADPRSASIEYHLGLTYVRLNSVAKAKSHLSRAVAIAPNSMTGKNAGTALARL